MGNKNTKFFNDLSKGATWSAGVAFKRSNPLPLDRYSVFETLTDAQEYASSNAVAYPGQIIAVAENGKMVAYVLAENTEGTALVLPFAFYVLFFHRKFLCFFGFGSWLLQEL